MGRTVSEVPMQVKLVWYMDSGFPILYINSFEELDKTKEIILASKQVARNVREWSYANGFTMYKNGEQVDVDRTVSDIPLSQVLQNLMDGTIDLTNTTLLLKDAHLFFDDIRTITLLKELVNRINSGLDVTIIFLSPVLQIPTELEKFVTIVDVDYPNFSEIRSEIIGYIEAKNIPKVENALVDKLAMALKGLTKFEIRNLLSLSSQDDAKLTEDSLKLIFEQKKQLIMKSGILEMVKVKETIDDIGGLENMKAWLKKKAKVIKNINKAAEFRVDNPKGVLIAGVPGCGKSLNAKAAAAMFEVPLLRMDMGRLMGKYVGESEGNLRKAIALAEAIAPCVLWIDELEKAFAGIGKGQGGSEVTTRLFGNFLTWMQEKESPVFVMATANNITDLPPELMRKGRFDEIFFVDLPKPEERKKILEIHIKKRRPNDFSNIDLNKLVDKTEGYSGADIEGVVKDAVEEAFVNGEKAITTEGIMRMIEQTHSLSEIMKEPLEKMKKEYEDRKFKNASQDEVK